jgi:hypothetical protein
VSSRAAGSAQPTNDDDGSENHADVSRHKPRHAWPFPWWLPTAAIFVVLLGARVILVRAGWLFGTGRIVTVDAVIGAGLVVAIALGRHLSTRRAERSEPPPAGSLTDWLGIAAAVLGLPALVISLSNLFAPPTPNGLSPSICTGAPAYGWDYYGVTNGPIGNYARVGPGIPFKQTDRFDSGCSLGFAGFCVGDPVEEPLTHWLETRWLLVGQHEGEPSRTVARLLSAEASERRFVSHAYVAPKSPDADLKYLGDEVCAQGRPRPGPVAVKAEPQTPAGITFELRVDNAERVGIAIELPRTRLRAGSAIRPVYSEPTDLSGTASITWNVARTAQQLIADTSATTDVTVLANACLGPVGPADVSTAAHLTFRIAPNGTISRTTQARPDDEALGDLNRAACDSETYPVASPSTPATSPSK